MFSSICSPTLCVVVFIQPVPWSPPSASGVQELLSPFPLDIYLSIHLLALADSCLLSAVLRFSTWPFQQVFPETRTLSHTRLRTDRELVTCKCKPAKSAGVVARETSIITPPLSPNFSYCLE